MSCHRFKDESVMENFGFPDLCIECNNPDKWIQIKLREKYGNQYSNDGKILEK